MPATGRCSMRQEYCPFRYTPCITRSCRLRSVFGIIFRCPQLLPEPVRIARARQLAARDEAGLGEMAERLSAAADRLETAIDTLIAG
mgnify:CR=1 FL=1